VAVGGEQRRTGRRPSVERVFAGEQVEAALDLLQLMDMAWHDCYGPREVEVPTAVLDDVLLLSVVISAP
jgi:hypothetical protein